MGSETDKLVTLCRGVRTISPALEIKVTPSESSPEQFCITVSAGAVIIIFTGYGELDTVLSLAISKLANISQRTLAAVRPSGSDGP